MKISTSNSLQLSLNILKMTSSVHQKQRIIRTLVVTFLKQTKWTRWQKE